MSYINIICPTVEDFEAVVTILETDYCIPCEEEDHEPQDSRGVYVCLNRDCLHWNGYTTSTVVRTIRSLRECDPDEPRYTAKNFLQDHRTIVDRHTY